MAWFDFSDLVTEHFNMVADTNVRAFVIEDGAMVAGIREDPTYTEVVFAATDRAFVPRAPKNFYDTLPADKRERDYCLLWLPPDLAVRLTTAKFEGNENAGRILDVDRNKWYVVAKEWDYLRQGNLNGVIGELVDGPPPDDLPPPPV